MQDFFASIDFFIAGHDPFFLLVITADEQQLRRRLSACDKDETFEV
ncbi:lipid A biosynthesis lauroyl acyltransferase [Vibrio cholerae]|nr:lipid A biosynthesis lauroyl acyltransferase [Vibrio cholerae]TXY76789.1 lipid A biosynthesis lauroyl acyltransferase [Vibrio cholerae]